MHEAEQSMAMRAFRSLPKRWQAVLWHTEVEDESPSEVATLFGLDANGTRVLASRAREGLKQAYPQAHVSTVLADNSAECGRYADRLGAYARGGLRTRAGQGSRKHLEECAACRVAAGQIKEIAGGIPAVVPIAVIAWFGPPYTAPPNGPPTSWMEPTIRALREFAEWRSPSRPTSCGSRAAEAGSNSWLRDGTRTNAT